MGENSTSGIGILKGQTIGLSSLSASFSGTDTTDGGENFHTLPRIWNIHRQQSEDSTIVEVPEDLESTELQKRLFQQKYHALKVQKEKKKVDRNSRTFGKPRDKYFQLPDDVRFALHVACGDCEPPSAEPSPMPKIVSEGVVLFSPKSPVEGVTCRTELTLEDGGTTRREKEVRIVEHTPSKPSSSRTPTSAIKKLHNDKAGKSKQPPTPEISIRTPVIDDDKRDTPRSVRSSHSTSQQNGNNSENSQVKENDSAFQRSKINSRNGSGQANNGTSHHSRISSGKSDISLSSHTCGRCHSANRSMPCSRPTSTSSCLRVKSPQRRQSRSAETHVQQRRKSRVSSGTMWRNGNESDDSDYFDSDSEFDPVYTPLDTSHEVSLYRRACRRHRVVTSKRAEEGLKRGKVDVSYSQLTRGELKVLCVAILESDNITQVDLAGNALPERCLSYLCEVLEENHHIKELNLSDCQADREGVGSLVRCLQRSNSLTSLDISGIGLCTEQVRIVSEYMENSSSLQRLCLSYCEIDEAGATILAGVLGSTICLSYLDLSWNQLRHKGALTFCMALKDNDTIQHLDLSWNGLGRDGCMGLEVALRNNSVLRHLDISSNRIGVLGLEFLLKGLHRNGSLNSMKMGNNPLPTDSGTAVINTLLNSPDSALCMLDLSHIAVEDEFLAKLTELRKSRVVYVYHGHVMSRIKDPYEVAGNRSLASFDPILVLFEYMKLQNMRLIDLFRSIDSNGDKVISKEELRAVFLSLNMSLPTGTFEAMFHKLDKDHSNSIDMDEMKLVHRRVMRQARVLKARATNAEEDEFGDITREFQDLVRKAVATRRSLRPSRGDLDRSLSPSSPRDSLHLMSLLPSRRRSSLRLPSPASRRSSVASDVRRGSAMSRASSVDNGEGQ